MPDNRDKIRLEGDSTNLVVAVEKASRAWQQYNQKINETINIQNNVQNNFTRTTNNIKNITVNMAKAEQSAKGLTVSLSGMARLVGVQLIHRGISSLTRNLMEGAKEAVQVEKALAEVRTISQDNQLSMDKWYEGVKRLSNAYGTDLRDQIEAAYQTLSNQVAEGADVFKFLEESNQFAAAAVTDSSTAVNLLTSAINSYGLEAADARDVGAQFFKTIELGRVRATEMANSFGDVSVLSNTLGIELHELLGTISALSVQGIKYNKTATQLRGVFAKLLKPTTAMKELFKEWGVETGEQAIKTFGLVGVLEKLRVAINGNSSEAAKLVPRVRGLTATLAATGSALELVKTNIDEVKNSTESYGKAIDEVMNNAGKRAEIASQRVKNAFLTQGRVILDFWTDVIAKTTGIYDDIDKEREEAKIAAKFETDMREMNIAYNKGLQERHRDYLTHVAEINAAINARTDKELESFNETATAAQRANKIILEAIKSTTKASNKEFDELSSNIEDANQRIIDLVREEDRTLFQWSQESKNTAGKIEGIMIRLGELRKKQTEARIAGDKKAFDEYGKARLKMLDQARKLDQRLEKDNKSAMEKRLELAKKIEEIQREGANKEAELAAKRRGAKPSQRRDIDRKRNENKVDTLRKVKDLREEYDKIEVLERKRYNWNTLTEKSFEQQREQYKLFIKEQEEGAKKLKATLIRQEVSTELLKEGLKSFKKFDIDKDISKRDPTKLRAMAEARRRNLRQILESSKDLGIDPSKFSKTSLAIFQQQQALDERADRLEKQVAKTRELEEANKHLQKSFEDQTEALRKRKEAMADVTKLQAELIGAIDLTSNVPSDEIRKQFEEIQRVFSRDNINLENLSPQSSLNWAKEMDIVAKRLIHAKQVVGGGASERIIKGDVAGKLGELSRALKEAAEVDDTITKMVETEDKLKTLAESVYKVEKSKSTQKKKQTSEVQKQLDMLPTVFEKEQKLRDLYKEQLDILKEQAIIKEAIPLNASINNPVDSGSSTNNNNNNTTINKVGDIKVNLNSTGDVQYDAALIGREIKRAVRRRLV